MTAMDQAGVEEWVAGYERAWRSPGTGLLAGLFTVDATYLPSPWGEPIRGLDALEGFWDAEREGPEERFTMSHRVLAVDGDTAVVRVEVDYATGDRWRDLWVLAFDGDGRCSAFEEWPFAPRQRDGH
jgi:ketosteroid isomerase-like protein